MGEVLRSIIYFEYIILIVIEEANWLTLYDDIKDLIGTGFDAVICLGNSFAHMADNFGDQREQKQAIKNFEKCLKPGGLLIIDHRNYDNIMETGQTPGKSIYYNVSFLFSFYEYIQQCLFLSQTKHSVDIKTSVLYVAAKPQSVIMDYFIEVDGDSSEFRLSYYPHQLKDFKKTLQEIFNYTKKHEIFGDFKSIKNLNCEENPAFFIHMVEKTA